MTVHIVFSVDPESHTTWGVASNKEKLEEIKKKALDTLVSGYKEYLGHEPSEEVIEKFKDSIIVSEMELDKSTEGVDIVVS